MDRRRPTIIKGVEISMIKYPSPRIERRQMIHPRPFAVNVDGARNSKTTTMIRAMPIAKARSPTRFTTNASIAAQQALGRSYQ